MWNKSLVLVVVFMLSVLPNLASADVNTPHGWGFKRAHDGKSADAGAEYESILENHDAVYKGTGDKKTLYLTFDNGYENGFTEQILDVLKQEQVPAAFFITGHYIRTAGDLVKRMVDEGHVVGNHSWSHPDFTQTSKEELLKELEKVRQETEALTGQKNMQYVRPPRGVFSERTLALIKEAGYTHVFWSVSVVDWNTDAQKGWQHSYDHIMEQLHPGAVLLLHTVSEDNAKALQKVIQDAKSEGYTFQSLDQLMVEVTGDAPF